MTGLETLHADVPASPPNGSVVLTPNGKAWQRAENGHWFSTGSPRGGIEGSTWEHLIADHGTLTLLHVGGK